MQIRVAVKELKEYEGDALIVNIFEKQKKPGGATAAADAALKGLVARKIERGEIKGKLGEVTVIPAGGRLRVENVLVAGLGDREKFDLDRVRQASAAAARRCGEIGSKRAGTVLHGAGAGGISPADSARAIAEGAILGAYAFDRYRTKKGGKKDEKRLRALDLLERDRGRAGSVREGARLGTALAGAAVFARDMVNEPPSEMTPAAMARIAVEAGKEAGVEVKVHGKKDMEKMGMGAILGVARGSAQQPAFIVMRYRGAPGSKDAAGLIGKGITFDSGGLSLKPAKAMEDMKSDMSGGAAVIAVMRALGTLKPRINVTGIVPAVENMPGGSAQKVGDVLKTMSGRTVEVVNTDAEGRLILADAIEYARREKLSPIVDVATLTGACVVALGDLCAGAFGNDDELVGSIIAAGAAAGEKIWRLPVFDEYKELNKSDVADIKNAGGKDAGAITAALFLGFFYNDAKWCHLDVAGPAFAKKDKGYIRKGATGVPVRTLLHWLLARSGG
ncbi:MAG: leucyl aminopeptidase [bacterium]